MSHAAVKPLLVALATLLLAAPAFVAPLTPLDRAPKQKSLARQAYERMNARIDILGLDPNTPFEEALDFFSAKYGVTFLIDVQAFQNHLQIQEPEAQPVKLPKMTDVKLRTVLHLLGRQTQGVFVQRGDIFWFVPTEALDQMFDRPIDVKIRQSAARRGGRKD